MTRIRITALITALILAQFISLGYIYGAEKPAVIKKADLPALKGGKVAKNNDGIPGCATGRAKLDKAAQDAEPMLTWSATHQQHPCFGAATVYVCRVGKNLSVRCE